MSGLLVYTQDEARRNDFAVNKFTQCLDVRLCIDGAYDHSADFVINRTDDPSVAEYYESKGIRVFNSAVFCRLANDKQQCYDFMQSSGIEIMPTRITTLPAVVKPKNGKGGSRVRLVTQGDIPYDDNMVIQQPASDLGKDLRVWIIGKEIVFAALRQSSTDFRSNFCLGGRASEYRLNSSELRLIKKIMSLVRGDYYGIDFVFNNGKIVFNELEDAVGARIVYSLTDIDIINLYCKYIKNVL